MTKKLQRECPYIPAFSRLFLKPYNSRVILREISDKPRLGTFFRTPGQSFRRLSSCPLSSNPFVNMTSNRCQRTQQGMPRDPSSSLYPDAPVNVLLSQDPILGPHGMMPLVSSGLPWFF